VCVCWWQIKIFSFQVIKKLMKIKKNDERHKTTRKTIKMMKNDYISNRKWRNFFFFVFFFIFLLDFFSYFFIIYFFFLFIIKFLLCCFLCVFFLNLFSIFFNFIFSLSFRLFLFNIYLISFFFRLRNIELKNAKKMKRKMKEILFFRS
jgi:hypothetical protein